MTASTRLDKNYAAAMAAAQARFQPLIDALMVACKLDTEPVVEQTGGMVMCLGIYWPEGDAYVWVSDYWWWRDDLILGLYDGIDHEGTYLEPPESLLVQLHFGEDDWPGEHPPAFVIENIAQWMAPHIIEHGARFGWSPRFTEGGQS